MLSIKYTIGLYYKTLIKTELYTLGYYALALELSKGLL